MIEPFLIGQRVRFRADHALYPGMSGVIVMRRDGTRAVQLAARAEVVGCVRGDLEPAEGVRMTWTMDDVKVRAA